MIKTLKRKIVIINAAIVLLLIIALSVMVIYSARENLERSSIELMEMVGRDPLKWAFDSDEDTASFFVVEMDRYGSFVAMDNSDYDVSDQTFITQLVDKVNECGTESGVLKEYGLRYLRSNIMGGPMGRGGGSIIFASTAGEEAAMKATVIRTVLIAALGFLIFLGFLLLLASWTVRPVEQAWTQQKQFVADASHELKTPLTVITTNAELLQAEDCTDEQKKTLSENIITMSHQMRGLVESLLELARVDNGSIKTAHEEVELSKIISDAVLPFEPLCFENGHILTSSIDDNIKVIGSERYLRQVAEILLDNANKYASPGGEINLELKKEKHSCLLTVSNPGDEMSPEDLKNIFKRFYRMDKVRSMNHSYGLGLSIADSIVKEHGGKIWAEYKDSQIRFNVQLEII